MWSTRVQILKETHIKFKQSQPTNYILKHPFLNILVIDTHV